jgi:hypothetical protein
MLIPYSSIIRQMVAVIIIYNRQAPQEAQVQVKMLLLLILMESVVPRAPNTDIGAYQFVAVNPPAVNPPTALKAVAQ